MNIDLSDSSLDLMESEQLHAFSVVELFCHSCDKGTPHQIDDEDSELHICVFCRKDEEEKLEY